MPIMPRTSTKCQRIMDKIQGKKPQKKTGETVKDESKTTTERQIAYEETSRIK